MEEYSELKLDQRDYQMMILWIRFTEGETISASQFN